MKKNITLLLLAVAIAGVNAQEKDIAFYTAKAPFKMPVVAQPLIKEAVFPLTDFGAVNDGKTLNTLAFAKAIEACNQAGGGRVNVPAGKWLTGPIELKSNVELHLEKNALIQFTTDHKQYPMMTMAGSKTWVVASPIYANRASNIAITGEGIIDGAGDSWRPVKKNKVTPIVWMELIKTGVVSEDGKIWWPSHEAMDGEDYVNDLKSKPDAGAQDYERARDFLRPYMVYFVQCDRILIQGVTLRNSPKFVFYPNRCTNLTMNSATVLNDWWAQNGDGIDISACQNVVIYRCTVSVGDDGICMKSSRGSSTADTSMLKNILIAGCSVFRAHGGFVIGSNTDGGMENIYVTDCVFNGSDIGIRVKSNPGRGGLVKEIYLDNIQMKNIVKEAILFTTTYEDVPAGKKAGSGNGEATDSKIPDFNGFYLDNISCEGASRAVFIAGLKESPVKNIHFSNMKLAAATGFMATDAKDLELKNVTFSSSSTPVYKLERVTNITVDGKPVE